MMLKILTTCFTRKIHYVCFGEKTKEHKTHTNQNKPQHKHKTIICIHLYKALQIKKKTSKTKQQKHPNKHKKQTI